MLDVSSQMTFRVHADGNGCLTLRFRRLPDPAAGTDTPSAAG